MSNTGKARHRRMLARLSGAYSLYIGNYIVAIKCRINVITFLSDQKSRQRPHTTAMLYAQNLHSTFITDQCKPKIRLHCNDHKGGAVMLSYCILGKSSYVICWRGFLNFQTLTQHTYECSSSCL